LRNRLRRKRKINSEHLVEYIKDLDLVFSRLIYRFRILFSRYTVDEITDTQFIVLRSLRKGPCNTSYLAQVLGVTLSAVTALINRLFKMGLVTRERQDQDRRQVWISITPKGLQVLQDVEDKRYLLLALYFSRIPEQERTELLEMLQRVIKLFEREDIIDEEDTKS
jgi:MarR family transcriptional regulator, organic hydroperoxide resistance regulator